MSADEYIVKLFFDRDRRAIEEADQKYGKYLLTVAKTYCKTSRTVRNV